MEFSLETLIMLAGHLLLIGIFFGKLTAELKSLRLCLEKQTAVQEAFGDQIHAQEKETIELKAQVKQNADDIKELKEAWLPE